MKGDFNSFQEVIDILHSNDVRYVILRNYDNLLTSNMYMDGHGDVDILCENSLTIVNLLGARSYQDLSPKLFNDGTHYHISIKGKRVKLDLRHVGDGYYCTSWEKDMLKYRVLSPQGLYVMDETNMLYSLLYHALVQKKEINTEYRKDIISRLSQFNITLDQESNERKQFVAVLEKFMTAHGYFYSYPHDVYVPLNKKNINRSMIKSNIGLRYKHMKFDSRVKLIQFLVDIRHYICRSFH